MKCPMMIKEAVYSAMVEKKRFLRKPRKVYLYNDDRSTLNSGVLSYKRKGYKLRPTKGGRYFSRADSVSTNRMRQVIDNNRANGDGLLPIKMS